MNGRHLLVASVISVQNSNFVYPSCQNCFSKLFIDLKRYSCPKCGCSGDTKEASYRYRLSLEVANTHDVFEVTVFGSCLDAYFGVTAKGLQRYIEQLSQEAREPDRDAILGVVFQAVETCFLGKKFVFGVKNSNKPDGTSSLQNGCQIDKYPKALTACQMFVPNPGLVGCTVFHYLQQHQCSHFKLNRGGFWPPDLFMSFDQPSRERSSLHNLDTLCTVPSRRVSGLSSFWPQSFGLTSSSVSSGATADLIALCSSNAACNVQKSEDRPLSLHSQSVCKPQDHNLKVNKKREHEEKKFHLRRIAKKSESESYSLLGREDCRSLQSLLDGKGSFSKISIQHSYRLEKSWNPLPPQRHDGSVFPCTQSFSDVNVGGNSQEVSWLWDELPSSESFNEFIAKIENHKDMVLPTTHDAWEHFPSKGIEEFHRPFNQSSPKPGIFSTNFIIGDPDEKLQKLAERVEVCKEGNFSCHQLNLTSFSSKESHQEASLSTEEKEKWGCWSSQHPNRLHWSSPARVKPHSNGSCLSSKEGVDQDVSSSKNLHSCSSLKSTSNCRESPCLQTGETTAHLNCKGDSNLAKWENKRSSSYHINQTADLTNIQEQGFTLVTYEKSNKVCDKERKLLPKVKKYNSRRGDSSSVLQGYSDCPEGSYNASADLFDFNASGVEATEQMFSSAHAFLAQEGTLTKKCVRAECVLSEQDISWNTSWYGAYLHNMFTTPQQKTSTPVSGSVSEWERSFAGTPDFVPNSQSTPLSRTCQQIRLSRGKESIFSELPLNKLCWINAKRKRPRPSLKNPLIKQLVSKFLQSRRSRNANCATTNVSDPQQLFIKDSPAQGLSENDGKEWIPPSQKKMIHSLAFQNGKTLRSNADCQVVEKSPLSKNKISCGIPKCTISFAPQRQQPVENGPICEDDVNPHQQMNESPVSCAFADVNGSNLSSTPCCVHNTADWSSELFTQ
ncbi:DNA damage-induced apoptosis suppressor protein [Rhineura floridana]|uniref:DNA damage-induced apoptosis suppressor protein n=1 Tax=Rhineura floridana TaxID=261503 RepID=UPI002AC7E72A|nr:DNA damage-induced apoptosis suppressor protein [Rhineura floridana]XP_061484933.1 DNA damage-induced apoptosis suppressor protein [Rhineura floridana]XP_061484934.1 DNA damage-induced apoptosis suppressor protein [Rhineura floridana]